jgi:hypothetical protein
MVDGDVGDALDFAGPECVPTLSDRPGGAGPGLGAGVLLGPGFTGHAVLPSPVRLVRPPDPDEVPEGGSGPGPSEPD